MELTSLLVLDGGSLACCSALEDRFGDYGQGGPLPDIIGVK